MSNFIDFHIHIDYYKNYKEMYQFFNNNKIYALFVTNLPEIYEKCKSEFVQSKYVKLALGYNPQLITTQVFNKKKFDKWFDDTKYIGEVGLDYSKEFIKFKEKQLEVFNYICNRAGKSNKILSIHSRKAEKATMEILQANHVKFAIFHWYSGDISFIDEILKSNYYFSVNYSMLTSSKGKKAIEAIPLNRLLIESDGPFGRVSKRQKEPYNIAFVYEEFSKFLNKDDLSNIVFNNLKDILRANTESIK